MAFDSSISVLIVDDASTMAHIIRNLLHRIGFKDVDEASGGPSALAKMKLKRYGLVISDWNMEPMTGIDLLRQVRADPGLGKTPFIMVTAKSRREHVIAAKEAGANNYIVKPFNAQTLQTKIEAVLAEKAEPRFFACILERRRSRPPPDFRGRRVSNIDTIEFYANA